MDKNLEVFNSLQNKAEREIERLKRDAIVKISSTEYAKIHLKENLNLYKIKVAHINSGDRNNHIVMLMKNEFKDINTKSLSAMLSLKGFLTLWQFVTLIYILIFPALVYTIHKIVGDTSLTIMLSYISAGILWIIAGIYNNTNLIKLYITKS